MNPDEMKDPKAVPVRKLPVVPDVDLSEHAVMDALEALGRSVFDPVLILATNRNASGAYAYAARFGARVIIMPDEFVKHPDHWMVIAGKGAVWSPGA